MILIDSKKAISQRFQNRNRAFFLFDEINVYASKTLIDLENKSRSANVTCVLATQSLSDLSGAEDEDFTQQIIENCNNYLVLRQNSAVNSENWANILGTRQTIDDMTVNAMALGRRTVAVTKGAMQTFSEDELKAIVAHEVGHIVHGDTIASIYAVVGNGILSVFVMLARLCLILIDFMQSLFSGRYSITSVLMLLLRMMFEASIWIFNLGMQIILSVNSRKSEFSADMF